MNENVFFTLDIIKSRPLLFIFSSRLKLYKREKVSIIKLPQKHFILKNKVYESKFKFKIFTHFYINLFQI